MQGLPHRVSELHRRLARERGEARGVLPLRAPILQGMEGGKGNMADTRREAIGRFFES
ncbi:hypothetical protein LCGC14_2171460, partial [marine sediment metagenome]